MSKPRLLDLFCGAGGASEGYAQAGFEVVGVDNRPQPLYPHDFVEEAQEAMGIDWMPWNDLREAVPPAYTRWIGRLLRDRHGR